MKVTVYRDREECESHHSGSEFFIYSGPIHKHGENKFVQLYMGQHAWVAVNIDNPTDARIDPGYDGVEFGWAHVSRGTNERISDYVDYDKKLEEPVSSRPSITHDELLFADRDKLADYLGENND